MKPLLILATALLLQGCDLPRNSPTQQAEDYAICQKAGMDSYLSSISEIKCKPVSKVR